MSTQNKNKFSAKLSGNISARAFAVAACGILSFISTPSLADTTSEIAELKALMRKQAAKLQQLEGQVTAQKKEAKQAKNVHNSASANDPKAPPPVFVDLRKGLFLETEDHQYAFKIGGRLLVDGGGIAGPTGNGWNGNVGFGQARLEVEGKMKSWFYKMQYDFANSTTQLWNTNLPNANNSAGSPTTLPVRWANNYVTDRNFLWGGWRDAFMGFQDARLSHPLLAQPVYFKIGSQYESFSLEALNSSKYRDLIERPMAVDTIAPFRHLGAAMGMVGKDNWTAHFGLYSLSFQDLNARPVNTSSGYYDSYVLKYTGNGAANQNWYQPYGGGAYWEATGRVTWAPIFDEHRLVHVGAAGMYHQQNSATAYSDDRNSAPGNRIASEANVLGTNFLGTPDLSCGRFNQPVGLPGSWNTASAVNGNCINNIQKVDLEAAVSYYNLFLTGEWLMSNTNRNPYAAQQFAVAQAQASSGSNNAFGTAPFISPANSRYVQTGGFVMGEWWITGEEKAQSYDQTDKNGVSFAQLKIKDKFSDGGWGAWGLVGRWSVLNLNNGPYQGSNLFNNLLLANASNTLTGGSAPAAALYNMQNMIANSGIYGGYQQNVTGGINWYPDNGVAFQFNATHVMALKSPLNWNPQASYESGNHPTLIEMRTKIYF